MFEYLVGKISYINDSYLILENNFVGYKVWVNNPALYEKGETTRIYIFTKVAQSNKGNFLYEYYGFKSISEKIFFENLITINGIGPKTALLMLKNDIGLLKELIKNDDVLSLEMLPGFNNKSATVVCSQLGYKFRNEFKVTANKPEGGKSNTDMIADIISALKALGYKKSEIESAINVLGPRLESFPKDDLSLIVSEAIKIILNNGETITN